MVPSQRVFRREQVPMIEEALSKLSIGHLRELLRQPGLSVDKRKVLQALLTKEEFNLDRLRRGESIGARTSRRHMAVHFVE
jgi:hypothetical protein